MGKPLLPQSSQVCRAHLHESGLSSDICPSVAAVFQLTDAHSQWCIEGMPQQDLLCSRLRLYFQSSGFVSSPQMNTSLFNQNHTGQSQEQLSPHHFQSRLALKELPDSEFYPSTSIASKSLSGCPSLCNARHSQIQALPQGFTVTSV